MNISHIEQRTQVSDLMVNVLCPPLKRWEADRIAADPIGVSMGVVCKIFCELVCGLKSNVHGYNV